jgi:hypothetical protein
VETAVVDTPPPRRRLVFNMLKDAQLLRQFKNGGCGFDFLSRHRQLGRVSILREGLERAAWLSVYGEGEQRRLAAEFVSYIPQRAEEAGKEVYEKAREIIEEGKARGSLTLKGFEKEVEVNGEKRKVKVIGGEAAKERQNGKTLLRIEITAEVDGVRREYVITYGRYGKLNAAVGYAYARCDAPEVR